jgi:hypothetical protein
MSCLLESDVIIFTFQFCIRLDLQVIEKVKHCEYRVELIIYDKI